MVKIVLSPELKSQQGHAHSVTSDSFTSSEKKCKKLGKHMQRQSKKNCEIQTHIIDLCVEILIRKIGECCSLIYNNM